MECTESRYVFALFANRTRAFVHVLASSSGGWESHFKNEQAATIHETTHTFRSASPISDSSPAVSFLPFTVT